jgi:hypothetical protein
MKIILIIIAVGVGMIQTVARAAEEPPWSLEGRMISADSCGADCLISVSAGGIPSQLWSEAVNNAYCLAPFANTVCMLCLAP